MAALWEMRNAIFRGELSGAGGTARFQLTADAVNAVDAVNINDLAVSFQYVVGFWETVPASTVWGTLVVPVPDNNVLLEVVVPTHNTGSEWDVYANGVLQTRYNTRGGYSYFPSPGLWYIQVPWATTITIQLWNKSASAQDHFGFVVARYMRLTGSDNI